MSQINKIELSIKEKKELKESELLQHLRGMKNLPYCYNTTQNFEANIATLKYCTCCHVLEKLFFAHLRYVHSTLNSLMQYNHNFTINF